MKKITIPYFSPGIKYATPVVMGLGIYLWTIGYPIWFAVSVLLTAVVLPTRYVTEISLVKKEYRDFLSVLWIPIDEENVKFNSLNKIVILKEKHSQMLNSRSRSRQLDWASFTGTLIYDDDKTLDLLARPSKKELIEGLKEFADFLELPVEDQTTHQHYLIDFTGN